MIVGVVGMLAVAQAVSGIGLRPTLVLSEASLALPGLLALVAFRRPLTRALALFGPPRRTALLSCAAGLAFWVASLGLFELQYLFWPPPPGLLDAFRRLHEALRPSGPLDALVSILAIAVVPAACEELLFRGLVLGSFLRPLGGSGAVLGSALLFGLIHVDAAGGSLSLYRVPFAFAVGIGLGILRLRSGSLVPSFLAHALLNTVTFIAVPLTETPYQGLPKPEPVLGAALFVVGAIGAAAALRFVETVDSTRGST